MRKNFYFAVSVFFWLVMAVGFSDNWLWDRQQESNSDWRMLVHAVFAFSWFTILVVQTGLIRNKNYRQHKRLGIAGMVVFAGFLVTTLPFYGSQFLETGKLAPLSTMVFVQLVLATVLIVIAFLKRKTDSETHKTHIMVGSLLLLQPAADRAIGHLFGRSDVIWLVLYLALFALFVWYHRKIRWQVAAAFVVWAAGVAQFVSRVII